MDNNATNFTYPGTTSPAVTPPPANGQSGQFANVAPPVSPNPVDDSNPSPTLEDMLQAENVATTQGSSEQNPNVQSPLVGDIDGAVTLPVDGQAVDSQTVENNIENIAGENQVTDQATYVDTNDAISVTNEVTNETNTTEGQDKGALASLAEKLNSFKASLVEEVPDTATSQENPENATVDNVQPLEQATNTEPALETETVVDELPTTWPVTSTEEPVAETPSFDTPQVEETPSFDVPQSEIVQDTIANDDTVPQYDPAQNVNPVMYSETTTPDFSPPDFSNPDTTPVLPPEQPFIEDFSNSSTVVSDVYPFTIYQLLDIVMERNASDLHLTVGYPASIRVDGSLIPVSDVKLTQEMVELMIGEVLPEAKKELLEVNREVDLAYAHGGVARFRINAFFQQQTLAAAFRLIPTRIKTIDELQLPQIYHQLTKLRQGFVLVTGPTGSGKSTTLAAILQEINQTRPDHLITVEDPIEYIFPKGKAIVNQRELHEDTHSWDIAMKSALRQDPDVVLVGEMRDYETVSAAITLAETGHLVFATLHTNSCSQTIDRIIDVFPEHQQAQVRSQLSNVLEAVVAQRLIPLDKGGRKAVSEIMIATAAVRNLIREGKTHQLDNVIRTSADIGMVSLEQSLVKLVREGLITIDRAQEYAVRPEEVVRLLKG